MKTTIRPAKLDDIEAIVEFIQMAAGGITEFLLTDLIPDMSTSELIEMALTDENTPYYYQNILVAEADHKLIAASNFYPSEYHHLPDIMRSFISEEKLAIVQPYLESRVENSMYIHTLSVLPEYRHSSVGLDMCKKIEHRAKELGLDCLSAHVWRDNTPVFNALKLAGFQEQEHLNIPYHPLLPHTGGMVLLKGSTFR